MYRRDYNFAVFAVLVAPAVMTRMMLMMMRTTVMMVMMMRMIMVMVSQGHQGWRGTFDACWMWLAALAGLRAAQQRIDSRRENATVASRGRSRGCETKRTGWYTQSHRLWSPSGLGCCKQRFLCSLRVGCGSGESHKRMFQMMGRHPKGTGPNTS